MLVEFGRSQGLSFVRAARFSEKGLHSIYAICVLVLMSHRHLGSSLLRHIRFFQNMAESKSAARQGTRSDAISDLFSSWGLPGRVRKRGRPMSQGGPVCSSSSTLQGPRPRTSQAARDLKVIIHICLGGGVGRISEQAVGKTQTRKIFLCLVRSLC